MSAEHPALLITDDDRDLRETLQIAFEPWGLRTFLAADGREAVEFVQKEQIDLLLMDMHMPRLTGIEAILEVRKLDLSLPCILMSAHLDDEIRAAARQAKVFSVQSKPLSFEQITRVVGEALQQSYNWSRPAAG